MPGIRSFFPSEDLGEVSPGRAVAPTLHLAHSSLASHSGEPDEARTRVRAVVEDGCEPFEARP